MYICYTDKCRCLLRPEGDIRPARAKVTDGCKPHGILEMELMSPQEW